ncbi:MAG: hypothetical protein FD174_771 [Geobacteraceae bacterium]|nr:MAG: hypothetical protein FD174_771 [Geobacteraceae bacterium]
MRKLMLCLAVAVTVTGTTAHAADVGFNVGVSIGNVPRIYAPAPPYAPPPVVIEQRPEFVQPAELGFYAAVGVPYDLFYVSGRYYLSRGNVWYSAPYYNGPWVTARYQTLPWGLRRYPFERIRYYRDMEYRRSCDHDGPQWGRYITPDQEWRERRRHDQRQWKEARRWEKEYRKHDRERWHDDDDDDD